ncbi:hypothetical protein NUU61_004624 [Penicillium alfredii]|uniref:NAD(P)-binding domain-containing protein n=1 Tax=Penicillium alfredii TaxID=1506179 RepID=A0A9W9FLJ5_9EURO|nr:uncharacterized protein NUU61_004624 [Penicillium alfredii]KAJ5102402.1 hypothetical protein NUU61_004624 [Penicillium alfredii]
MKVILAGSTGFIGGQVLDVCLQSPAITSLVALTRRELPAHQKLQSVIVEDFRQYPDSVREAIHGADACIWTLGKARMPDDETARRVSVEYTLAAARALQETAQKKIRFVYCSGGGAEKDQNKPLWFMQEYRRIRGQVENDLLAFAHDHASFEPYILRPGMVLSREVNLRSLVFSLGPSVKVDTLAAVMVDLALKGAERTMWENADINQAWS